LFNLSSLSFLFVLSLHDALPIFYYLRLCLLSVQLLLPNSLRKGGSSNVTVIANTLVVLLISIGVIFTVVAVIGVLRLPDIYTRSHASTKSVTFGVLCPLTGVFLYLWLIEGDFNIKLLLGISFLLFTAPIGGHLMARAAYLSGVEPDEITEKDELKEVVEEAKQKENIPNKE